MSASYSYCVVLQYVENKAADNDWFRLESNKERKEATCICLHPNVQIPVTYPATALEKWPFLSKMGRQPRCTGGKICLTDHFKPLWARNVPKFGLAHLMALGLGPWLAVEIPDLIAKAIIEHKDQQNS